MHETGAWETEGGPFPDADEFRAGAEEHFVLRLYVTGMAPHSALAIENLHAILERHLKDRFELEIVDVYQAPERAREAQLIAAPTLVKLLPLPVRRLIGDLSDEHRVLAGLAVRPAPG